MQVTKKSKYTILISIFILISFFGCAQEDTVSNSYSDTLITQNDSVKTRHKFSLKNLFKKKIKNEDEINDTTSSDKTKFSFKNLFKRKNNQDSIVSANDSVTNDSSIQKKRFSLYKKNKNDSTKDTEGNEKPQRITPGLWVKMNTKEQDSLLRAWDDYDRKHYKKKYSYTSKEKERDMKRDKSFTDKLLLKLAVNKPFRYRKKLINKRNSRYRKTMIFDRLKKSDTAPGDTISDKERYKIVNKQFKREGKREAIRKNKTALKYDRKEERLRKRYALSDNERKTLNKGTAMRLKGDERIIFNKAKNKQEKFSTKLLELRRKRSFALQNKEVQKKMKEDQKRIAQRDKAKAKKMNSKKRDKDKNKKYDSSEYPKRWFK